MQWAIQQVTRNVVLQVCQSFWCWCQICDRSFWCGKGLRSRRHTVGHIFCTGLGRPDSWFYMWMKALFWLQETSGRIEWPSFGQRLWRGSSGQTAREGVIDFPKWDATTTPTTTSIPRMGPTGHHLPSSPLQNSEDFEKTSEHSSCPDTLKAAIPDTPIVALMSRSTGTKQGFVDCARMRNRKQSTTSLKVTINWFETREMNTRANC